MLNPHMFEAGYVRWTNKATGRKHYLIRFRSGATYVLGRCRQFRTASEAMGYSNRALARWRRLYDARQRLREPAQVPVPSPKGTL